MILIACEFSGIVRNAFIKAGFDAISCDLLDTEKPGPHIKGNVTKHLRSPWQMVIAHPPCTRLANSGVRWLHERNLWRELDVAADFFQQCLNANAQYIAVENPVMHKYAVKRIGRKQDFCIQPWQFGEPYTKRTCFWTQNLPALTPTKIVSERYPEVHKASPGPQRWMVRSRTYQGIADAMVEQWGKIL